MLATVGLVFGFRTSTNLAAAYGMAVTTTMVITTLLAYRRRARAVALERRWRAGAVTAAFLSIDLAFFGANVIKIEHGGWFPLLVAGAGLHRDDHLARRAAGWSSSGWRDRRCR